jgi:hypothetical protein
MPEVQWIPLKQAEQALAGHSADLSVHINPRLRSNYFRITNSHLIGDVPVRGRKANRKWHVNEDDLTRAIARIATLPPLEAQWSSIEPTSRMRRRWKEERTHPGHLSWRVTAYETFTARESPLEKGHPYYIAGIDAAAHVRRAGSYCALPTPLIDLLDGAEKVQRASLRQASRCACGGSVPLSDLYHLRHDRAEGWVTICLTCRAAEIDMRADYDRSLHGISYDSKRVRSENPETYRCALCGMSARVWDHCHDHGLVRGPLCGSCNQIETYIFANSWSGQSLLHESWQKISAGTPVTPQQVVEYLQNCKTCADLRTIPTHHWAYLAHEGLWGNPRTHNEGHFGRCTHWSEEERCRMFRLRNHKAASALVPLFWNPPGEPNMDWWCRIHRRPARPYGITSERARSAALERMDALRIAGIDPPGDQSAFLLR